MSFYQLIISPNYAIWGKFLMGTCVVVLKDDNTPDDGEQLGSPLGPR
jgi:hypothetical protein